MRGSEPGIESGIELPSRVPALETGLFIRTAFPCSSPSFPSYKYLL